MKSLLTKVLSICIAVVIATYLIIYVRNAMLICKRQRFAVIYKLE